MATIFFFQLSSRLQKDLHASKVNSSDISFSFSLITVFSEPIFELEAAFVLFSNMPQKA